MTNIQAEFDKILGDKYPKLTQQNSRANEIRRIASEVQQKKEQPKTFAEQADIGIENYKKIPVVGGAMSTLAKVGKVVANVVAGSEQKFGQDLGQGFYTGTQQYIKPLIGGTNTIEKVNQQYLDSGNQLINVAQRTADPTRKQSLLEAAADDFKKTGMTTENIIGQIRSNEQILGDAGGVLLDILSVGSYGKAGLTGAGKFTTGLTKAAPIAEKAVYKTGAEAFTKGAVKAASVAAPIGAGYGATSAMQEDKSTGEIAKSAAYGGLFNAILAGTLGGLSDRSKFLAPQKVEKLKQKAAEQYKRGLAITKEKYKEKADKLIPDLLKENISGTRKQLTDKAMKGIELSNKEYEQLGELKGYADIDPLITNIEDEIQKYGVGAGSSVEERKMAQRAIDNWTGTMDWALKESGKSASFVIPSEKDDLIAQLTHEGLDDAANRVKDIDFTKFNSVSELKSLLTKTITESAPSPISVNEEKVNSLINLKDDLMKIKGVDKFQESLHNTDPMALQEDLRKLARDYGTELYETRKSVKTISDSKTLSQVRKVDASIRGLLANKNPSYAKINEVYHMNSELADILKETQQRESSGMGVKNIIDLISTVGGLVAGAATGGGDVVRSVASSLIGGSLLGGLAATLQSTWWNTMRAVQKYNAAEKLLNMPEQQRNQAIILLERQGAKYAKQIGLIP